MKTYVSLAISDSMFPPGVYRKDDISVQELRAVLKKPVVSVVNPSHRATLDALRERFDLDIPIPERAEKVQLEKGDTLVVCTVLGLPRVTREFTKEEIDSASFCFSQWTYL